MKKMTIFIIILGLMIGTASLGVALEKPIIFPKDNQTKEQQATDESFCKNWASDETNVEPGYVRAKIEAGEDEIKEYVSEKYEDEGLLKAIFKTAAKGAAKGALDDAFNENTEVAPQAIGGVLDGFLDNREEKKENALERGKFSTDQSLEELKEDYNLYMRAFAVCMDAKGYSVK